MTLLIAQPPYSNDNNKLEKFQTIEAEIMQNYPFLHNYPMGYTLPYPNPFYYPPIMFIDPSMHLLTSPSNPCFPKISNHYEQQAKGKEESGVRPRMAQKQDENYFDNTQKNNHQSEAQQKIQYLTVSNRNILPNNLNLILSYIRRINKSGNIVKKTIEKLNQGKNYSVKKFYSYQAYLKEKIPFHKTKYTLKQITQYTDSNFNIFTLQQQMFYNRVCKIVIFDFLRREYMTTLLISNKIQKTSKKDHLKVRRYLQLKISGAGQEDLQPYRMIQN